MFSFANGSAKVLLVCSEGKRKYFIQIMQGSRKKNPIGRLVTRTVNDIETIASIFSQGLFLIIADLLQMFLVVIVMLSVNFELLL